MPTADDYEQWARWFDERADALSVLLGPLLRASTEDVVAGGRLAATVDVAVRSSVGNADSVAAGMRTLATECRARAATCRIYEAAVGAWADRIARDRVAPHGGGPYSSTPGVARPVPPAPWVEVGPHLAGPR